MQAIGPQQRLRVTFGRAAEAKYISHLDMMRVWERLLRRARLPIVYSNSRPPRPRLALAAPLPVGVTSDGELLDVLLSSRIPALHLARRLAAECPPGIAVTEVRDVSLGLPALQTVVRFSEYRVTVAASITMSEMERRIAAVISSSSLPQARQRERETRRYDLRPQIDSLWLAEWSAADGIIGMLLQTDEQATGRPNDVISALQLSESLHSVHRVKLILAAPKGVADPGPPGVARGRRA